MRCANKFMGKRAVRAICKQEHMNENSGIRNRGNALGMKVAKKEKNQIWKVAYFFFVLLAKLFLAKNVGVFSAENK